LKFERFARYAIAASATLAVCLFIALPAGAQVSVTVDGNGVDFSPAPIIQAGRVFVPLRGVFERLGASVDYSNGTIDANGNGRSISLQIGSTQATVDGQPETIDVAPFIVGASTYVPLRFVSQALGAAVNWDGTDSLVSIQTAGAPDDGYAAPTSGNYVDLPPPAIPVYEQPYAPAPDYIWQPGYWAWGSYGYFWVPGTWVEAPQPGYLWTPGYWGWNDGGYSWHDGYWATAVGFYGGVNYGAGYSGYGYDGGRWENNRFDYNTYVTRVNITIVHDVYVDRTVYVNTSTTRTSYNGGPNGLQVRPKPQELAVAKAPHLGMTPVQRQHVVVAAQDRRLLASVNHDRPPVLAVAQPLSASNRPAGLVPVKASDRVTSVHTAPPVRAPVVHAVHAVPLVHAAPAIPATAVHTAPAFRAPVVHATPAIPATAVHTAPATHEPVVHTVPVIPATVVHSAPATRAPVVHAAPVMHVVPVIPPTVAHTAPATPIPVVHGAPVIPHPVVNTVPPARRLPRPKPVATKKPAPAAT